MLQTMKQHATTLAIFAFGCTSAVVATNALTEERILDMQQKQRQQQWQIVLPHADLTQSTTQSCAISLDLKGIASNATLMQSRDQNKSNGFAIEATTQEGYNGNIRLLIGFEANGNIGQVRVLQHSETPGLGDKIDTRISNWITVFHGKSPTTENDSDWRVTKDGGQFDAFTGATITPRAVVNAVREIAWYANQHLDVFNTQGGLCDGS